MGKALTDMTPEEVIQVMIDSNLRGRGGGGFPTGLKWQMAAGNASEKNILYVMPMKVTQVPLWTVLS